MNRPRYAVWVFVALAAVAAAFRFPQLAARPMHADEGVNADKLGTLLDHGRYEYSTVDYHGPTLYYAALLVARARGITRYADLNEATMRAVPAIFGVLLVAAHYLLIPYLGFGAAACAALLTAVSPAMVFYSRYFIHETLLEFFTFGALLALLAYSERPSTKLALAAGVMFGLMFATKETWIIAAFCMACGALPLLRSRIWVGLIPAFLLIAALLMSSLLTHPRGLVDSLVAYRTYFARGAGVATPHVHPWYFYFHASSEVFIAVLAAVGICVSKGVGRFLAIYTVLMIAIYCAIPYKVPWNLLGFLHGMILMAGIGAAWLAGKAPRPLVAALVAIGAFHLGGVARAESFQQASDPRNPWVYAHTGQDVFRIVDRVAALAAVHPAGLAMPLQIVTRENLWPLPWYLRRYSGVQWWTGVSDTAVLAPVILATPDMEPALLHRIYEVPPPGQREMYVNLFDRYVELRPRVEVRGYVAKSLWDQLPETHK